jgi:hypothetical protein
VEEIKSILEAQHLPYIIVDGHISYAEDIYIPKFISSDTTMASLDDEDFYFISFDPLVNTIIRMLRKRGEIK